MHATPDRLRAARCRYDGFVIDLWGVIHDGVTPYAGAVDCLERLAARQAVVLLSNAPRRADVARRACARWASPTLYTALLTSGEATRRRGGTGRSLFAALG